MKPDEKQIKVDYDASINKFLLTCPMWANDVVCSLPSRRWMKSKKAWAAPPIRKNIEYLNTTLKPYADFTKAAAKEILDAGMRAASVKANKGGFPPWYKFKMPPRKHQIRALSKLYPLSEFAMFMDRGTGKTKTTIDIACAKRMENKVDALLIVVKLSGRREWQEQFEVHAPMPISVHLPYTDKSKAFNMWLSEPADFKALVIGVESLSQGSMMKIAEKFMRSFLKPMMVVDESHFISNHKALRAENCVELGRLAVVRGALTGTPISTGPMNLFMQFEYLNPEIIGIGDFYSFRNRYAIMGGFMVEDKRGNKRATQIVGYQNLKELTETVAPYVFEVRKSDVLDLPPKVYKKVYVQLAKKQRDLYDRVRKEKAYDYDGREMVMANVLEMALRLHQIAGGFVTTYEEEETKNKIKRIRHVAPIMPWKDNPKIQEIIDIAADDKQVIIWCAYRPEIDAVLQALASHYPTQLVREIHGGISENDRHMFKDEFQSGKCKFLVGNTATGGTVLTLTACETMIYFNNTHKMVDREQSEDRAHRDGLKHSVLYIDLIAEKTVDELIIKSIQTKVDLAEYIRHNIREATDMLYGENS